MEYKDILKDVLAGKIVRQSCGHKWKKMKESGLWDSDLNKPDFAIERSDYDFDTWEVMQENVWTFGIKISESTLKKMEAHSEKYDVTKTRVLEDALILLFSIEEAKEKLGDRSNLILVSQSGESEQIKKRPLSGFY